MMGKGHRERHSNGTRWKSGIWGLVPKRTKKMNLEFKIVNPMLVADKGIETTRGSGDDVRIVSLCS